MSVDLLFDLIADALILLGTVVMTIGVIGIIRMPDAFMKIHAASKSVFLGVCAILAGTFDSADPAIITRAVLIGILLLLTTPVAAYEIARGTAREALQQSDEVSGAIVEGIDHRQREKARAAGLPPPTWAEERGR